MNIVDRARRRVARIARRPLAAIAMKRLGVEFYPPDYVYFDTFTPTSTVIDVGCGHVAEFSVHLIERYGLRVFGVDPTRKHRPCLQALEARTQGRFRHLALAVARDCGRVQFHESKYNESGSLLKEHANVRRDEIATYDVQVVDLPELVRRVAADRIDLLKLDLEGAEYELLAGITTDALAPFEQLFVEFHHHCTDYAPHDTRRIVARLRSCGLHAFTRDGDNYLFYRPPAGESRPGAHDPGGSR